MVRVARFGQCGVLPERPPDAACVAQRRHHEEVHRAAVFDQHLYILGHACKCGHEKRASRRPGRGQLRIGPVAEHPPQALDAFRGRRGALRMSVLLDEGMQLPIAAMARVDVGPGFEQQLHRLPSRHATRCRNRTSRSGPLGVLPNGGTKRREMARPEGPDYTTIFHGF